MTASLNPFQADQQLNLDTRKKSLLFILCLCVGAAPLACRWIPDSVIRFFCILFITAIFLAFALMARKKPFLQAYWKLSFAFFILAFVQLLNNFVPYFGIYVLHQTPISGNPLASTVSGTIVIQLLDTLIAVASVIALTLISGDELSSIYVQKGKVGTLFVLAIMAFVIIYIVTARHTSRLIPINGALPFGQFLALTPALLVLVISNGLQEEFLFRALFLQKYQTFFSTRVSIVLQAMIFGFAHLGVTYTPSAVFFAILYAFPLGLICGYLMYATEGVLTPTIFHAGVDIPIYLAFLSYVS